MNPRFGVAARRWDRVATVVITASGILIIATVIGIMLLIVRVALPLFSAPATELLSRLEPRWLADPAAVVAVGNDEYQEVSYVLLADGTFVFFAANTGELLERIRVAPPGAPGSQVVMSELHGRLVHTLLWSDGAVSLERVRMAPQFDAAGQRQIVPSVTRLGTAPGLGVAGAVEAPATVGASEVALASVARPGEGGAVTRATLLPGNRIRIVQQVAETDLFGDTVLETIESEVFALDAGTIGPIVLDGPGAWLYAGTDTGTLLRWELTESGAQLRDRVATGYGAITALAMVIGDNSVAVGHADGHLATWFPVPSEIGGATRQLREIHQLRGHAAPVRFILPSSSDKTLITVDEQGEVRQHYPTGERLLFTIASESPLRAVGYSLRTNALIGLDSQGRIDLWRIENPHPEFSWKGAFQRIWYEGFAQPGYVWQSSAATDDAEPKLSLVPLIFGTFKGTFYALLLAGPLAVLAAVYTSTLMDRRLRLMVKPAVEIMGAVPTVVIGFLAALWFAPLIGNQILAIFLFILILPVMLIGFVILWGRLRELSVLQPIRSGYEFLIIIPAVILALMLSVVLGNWVQDAFLGGDFRQWLFQTFGTRVDQRNSIIIAFALGFAVIPVIFTISEDALVRVPGHLRAASLALGATRWQTAWRVILPSASPGVFAGVMIGFGRAVGETMIVLMATGNTPIIDLSIFNGMRTLSANIAVEIPEAPAGGTLYRILFLTGVILFSATFVVNTAAEVVRHRLRKKYGRL